jgi:creatinine amidohydrolase
LTWQEAEAALMQQPIGLLPIGAIEAHGPHLPLDTDVIIASAMAETAARKLTAAGRVALVLPPVVYGVSFAGTSFRGTSPVEREAFEPYLASLLIHLARQGYGAIIGCNAHLEPAHFDSIHAACRAAEATVGIPIRTPDQRSARFAALLSDEFRAGARHAGGYETSILLAAKPDAVRVDVMRNLPPVWIDLPARLAAGARTFAEAGAALGYFGNPAVSTAEEGERMLDALSDMVMTTCQDAGLW